MVIDIHCHLERVPLQSLRDFIAKGGQVGAVAMTLESAHQLLALKKQFPSNIHLFLGVHPEVGADDVMVNAMLDLIAQHHQLLAGIGEIGIPYFYLDDKTDVEKDVIKQQGAKMMACFVAEAAKRNLPVNLHVVEDDIDIALPILRQYNITGALFHWYEGSLENLQILHQEGHFISVSPWIYVEPHYLEFAKHIPLDMLLVESDSPCKYNGKQGEPMMVFDVIATLASHHGLTVPELKLILANNTARYLNPAS